MTDNKINVGGRLHSIATGNVLVGADEIFDDDKNKKQSDINTETYVLVNEVNEKLATLSPEQQSALAVATKANKNEANLGYYVCDTESNIAAKVVANATGYILEAGGSIKIKMNNANTADNVTLNINSTGAKPLYYCGEIASATNTWENGETVEVYYDGINFYANNIAGCSNFATGEKIKNVGIDSKPTVGSDNLVKSGGVQNELALGAVYDVSAKNPTAGPNHDGKWESLSALLSDANLNTIIPTSVRKGGVSIKFVQSSDNKYVQFRCKSNSFTTNTDEWAVCNDEVLVDAPTYIMAETDADGRLLFWIKSDASVDWAVGVPTPVKSYVDACIAEILNGNDGTDIDGLNKVIAFLDGFSTSDTLANLLNTKVDKEEGKGLIQNEVAESLSVVEEPEFMDAELDSEGRVLGGRKANGTKIENVGFETPSVSIGGTVKKMFNDPENRKELLLDSEGRIISYRKEDGTKVEYSIAVNNLGVRNINLGEGARNSIKELIKILPSYYFEDDYINKRVLSIQTAIMQMGRGDIFGFLTDTHPMNKDNVNSGRILQYIASQTPIQKVLFGGDIGPSDATCYGADTKALEGLARSVMQQTERIYNPCREAGCEIYIARGNHDFASTDNVGASATGSGYLVNRKATRQTLFAYCDTNKIVTNDEDENAMYYYFDNELQKIRYIVVDTSDNQTDAFNPQSVQSNVATQISNTQIQWIVENAILTTPNDYAIVFMGHIVPAKVAYGAPNSYVWNDTGDKKSLRNLVSIIDAVQTNNSVTIDLMGGGTYTCDFESFVPKVLLCIAGHIHFDTQSYSNGCMYYMSGADLFTQDSVNFPRVEKQLFGLVLPQREYNSITENLVNIIIVDITNNKIRLFRIGSGVDKIFNTDTRELSTGSTLTLNSELNGNLKWKSYDATIFGPSNDNMFSHTITSVDENTGVVTGITAGESVVVAYSETDNSIEFFDIKVL